MALTMSASVAAVRVAAAVAEGVIWRKKRGKCCTEQDLCDYTCALFSTAIHGDIFRKGGIEVKGLHINADLYNCPKGELLTSSEKLRSLCVNACREVGLTVLGEHFYQFDGAKGTQDGGATGAVVLAESHLAVHTWPERAGATLDVYVCNFTSDNTHKA